MTNKKQSKIKVVLPVLFTFGASLLFFQTDGQADSSQVTTNNDNSTPTAGTTADSTNTTQSNNYKTLTVQSAQEDNTAQATTQSAVAASSNYAVSLSDSAVQSAASKPVVDTNPGYTTGQYNVSASPVNATGGANGASSLNTSGLSSSQVAFLNSIHDGAIQGWKKYGVLPSLTAAQAIIESGWGQSSLAANYHNLFGIKGSYNGHSVTLPTREVYGGSSVIINDAFRAYDNNSESVEDHGKFLVDNSRYHNLLWKTNYKDVTYLIRADGYATDPSYTTTLNSVIERYGLTAWDKEAISTNTGYLDNLSVSGNKIHISGWHASDSYNSSMHHFIILLDSNTGKELYRTEVSGVYRQDVQNVYPTAAISGWGGFDITIPYTSTFAGKNIQVVSRYTYNTNGEINGGKDIFFNPVSLNANVGYLDNMKLDANTGTINISGWHAADASLDKGYHYLIIYDASKHTELGRYLVQSSARNDVAKVFPGVYNAANSGFSLNLKFSSALAGDQIQVISRYSNSQNGEGSYVDYWFKPQTFVSNQAYLDNFGIKGNQLSISGWHAADQSVGKKYHYVIIYDASKHQELTRVLVSNTSRSDVAKACPNVYGAANSGFSVNVPLTAAMTSGDQIQVISRYTDDSQGNGNYTDYWFGAKTFNENQAYLDNFSVVNGKVNISGWHAADQSLGKPYHFIILYDATTGREIKRQLVPTSQRTDVAKACPSVYNASQSGFQLSTSLSSTLNGHEIQVISRYSNAKSGEGSYIDYWFKPIKLNIR